MRDGTNGESDTEDEMIGRVAESLRQLPRVDVDAKTRLLVAVAADRQIRSVGTADRVGPFRVPILGALVAAAIGAVVLLGGHEGGEKRSVAPPSTASRTGIAPPDFRAVSASTANEGNVAPVSVQLIVRVPAAHRVAVVGDFTGWDKRGVPMARDPASGLWNAMLVVQPGRHEYAFVVDDSVWMRDPRAPKANDVDFGRPGSVLLVSRR